MFRNISINEARSISKSKGMVLDKNCKFFAISDKGTTIKGFKTASERNNYVHTSNAHEALPLSPVEGRFLNEVLGDLSKGKIAATRGERRIARNVMKKLSDAGWND